MRERQLLEQLCIEQPWSWSNEGLDDCCMFCDSDDRRYTDGRYQHFHDRGCRWIEAMDYLGREHEDHFVKEATP